MTCLVVLIPLCRCTISLRLFYAIQGTLSHPSLTLRTPWVRPQSSLRDSLRPRTIPSILLRTLRLFVSTSLSSDRLPEQVPSPTGTFRVTDIPLERSRKHSRSQALQYVIFHLLFLALQVTHCLFFQAQNHLWTMAYQSSRLPHLSTSW